MNVQRYKKNLIYNVQASLNLYLPLLQKPIKPLNVHEVYQVIHIEHNTSPGDLF